MIFERQSTAFRPFAVCATIIPMRGLNRLIATCFLFLLVPVTLITVATSASAVDQGDGIGGWKTFSNRAGWSIKHPSNRPPSSCRSCSDTADPHVFVSFYDPSSDNGVMIEHMADKPAQESIEQWMEQISHSANENPVLSKEWITVSNVRALRVQYRNVSTSDEMESVYILRGKDTFSISASDIRDASFYAIYRKMLSTFQFHGR